MVRILPLPHMSQITAAGNFLIWREEQSLTIALQRRNAIVTTCSSRSLLLLCSNMVDTTSDTRRRGYQRRCKEITSTSMLKVFGTKPYPWQQEVIAHLCCMVIPHSGIAPAPVLLVRPTGGGKSSVRDIFSIRFSLRIK